MGAEDLTLAERASGLTRKLRMNLDAIAAETGETLEEITTYCERRWPKDKNPHLDNVAFTNEICTVLSRREGLRDYHPELFTGTDI